MNFYYDTTQDLIVHNMILNLSGLKYGYRTIVEGAFDATQRSSSMSVSNEYRERMKKECVNKVLKILESYH